jgi:hypothetical protein
MFLIRDLSVILAIRVCIARLLKLPLFTKELFLQPDPKESLPKRGWAHICQSSGWLPPCVPSRSSHMRIPSISDFPWMLDAW